MAHLSDDVLWQIAQSTMNQDKVAFYDILLERHKTEKLTPIDRKWLTQLREDADQLMLRKAHAYAILENRGHKLPTLEERHYDNLYFYAALRLNRKLLVNARQRWVIVGWHPPE
ncbi:hypothetical protein [Candidatus Parabeggiatoa sp. HSG14]|uniref:hypothetical protein n=1 Tax=Candidatus Parabeggiatoa sp. HSG14 TaxID=3055593 RepID=UPI0025A8A813|nr:hypothetical protein [Thiotrichales bacterium HSG14]